MLFCIAALGVNLCNIFLTQAGSLVSFCCIFEVSFVRFCLIFLCVWIVGSSGIFVSRPAVPIMHDYVLYNCIWEEFLNCYCVLYCCLWIELVFECACEVCEGLLCVCVCVYEGLSAHSSFCQGFLAKRLSERTHHCHHRKLTPVFSLSLLSSWGIVLSHIRHVSVHSH